MNYGTWLSSLGGVSWLFGFSLFPNKTGRSIEYSIQYKKLLWLSVALFVLFLMLAGNNFLSGGIYKGQGGSSAGEGGSVYIYILFRLSLLLLTVFVVLKSRDRYKFSFLSWLSRFDRKYLLLAGSFVFLFLTIGDRGGPLELIITFLVLFGTLVKPIKAKDFILIIIFGSILLTLVGIGRSSDSGDNILIAGAQSAELSSGYDLTINLANSAKTLYIALNDVPHYHDYFYGKLWLGSLLGSVPFAQNIYLKLSGSKVYELSSAGYITYLRFGLNPPTGEGTSLIADIFLNFGLFGVILFMFLLGLFFKKVQNEFKLNKNIYWIITAAMLASVAFYMGRSSLMTGYRTLVWGLLMALFVKSKKKIR